MKDFLSQFKSWAHWFAGAALSAWTVYATVPQVHDAVNNALASNKKLVALLGTLSSIALAYANSKQGQQSPPKAP